MSEETDFLRRVTTLLADQGWSVHIDDDGVDEDGAIQLLLSPGGESGAWPLIALVHPPSMALIVYSILPGQTPSSRRAELAETLSRINDGLPRGCAEMSWDDDTVRIRTEIELAGTRPSDEELSAVIERLVGDNLALAERYFGAIDAVAHDVASPAQAVASAEQG